MTEEKINEIYNNLLDGFCYSSKGNFKGFDLYTKNGINYIIYNNYGSSAVRRNKANLKWIIEVIFDDDISILEPKKDGYIYY